MGACARLNHKPSRTCRAEATSAGRLFAKPSNPVASVRSSWRASSSASSSLDVGSLPAPPQPQPPPKPVPVIHSATYLQYTQQQRALPQAPPPVQQLQQRQPATAGAAAAGQMPDPDAGLGNVVQWALRKVDDSLNEIEHNPPAVQKALFDLSRGPVGQATSMGVSAAAKFTVVATLEVAKAAAPVGKWALQEGLRAAVGLASRALEQEQQQERQQQQQRKQQQQQARQQVKQPVRQPQQQKQRR